MLPWLVLLMSACTDPLQGSGAPDSGKGTTDGGGSEDGGTSTHEQGHDGELHGEWLLGVDIGDTGAPVLQFYLFVIHSVGMDGDWLQATLGPMDADVPLGPTLVECTAARFDGVPFEALCPTFTVPADGSPILGELALELEIHASEASGKLICGGVAGWSETLKQDLGGSTFGAVPWGFRDESAPSDCDQVAEATPQRALGASE